MGSSEMNGKMRDGDRLEWRFTGEPGVAVLDYYPSPYDPDTLHRYPHVPFPARSYGTPPPASRVAFQDDLSDDELQAIDERLAAADAERAELGVTKQLVESLKAQLELERQAAAFFKEALKDEREAHALCRKENESYRASLADAYVTLAKLAGKAGGRFSGLVNGALLTIGALLGAAVSN